MKEETMQKFIEDWKKRKGARFYSKANKKAQELAKEMAWPLAIEMFKDCMKEYEAARKRLGIS